MKTTTGNKSDLFFEKPNEGSGLDFSTNMDKYIKHIETLETLNHALWLLLEEHGATHEELNEKIAIILEQKKMQNGKFELECSNCHQKMQMSGAFKCKCIYCGAEFVSNPYQIKFNQNNVPEVIDAVSEEVVEESPIESGAAFEPYDVSKDLGFDTEE